ncbi:hypothetical protein K440DRAFT_627137 [Wilcoxina mikolae CBS 423.85]|nr:hypothetical protein K440DRAFT_627137 [Wilcoxina mikolae CBS 423.85]
MRITISADFHFGGLYKNLSQRAHTNFIDPDEEIYKILKRHYPDYGNSQPALVPFSDMSSFDRGMCIEHHHIEHRRTAREGREEILTSPNPNPVSRKRILAPDLWSLF